MYTYTQDELWQMAKDAAREAIAKAKADGRADRGKFKSFCLGLPGADMAGHISLIVHFEMSNGVGEHRMTWSNRTNIAI